MIINWYGGSCYKLSTPDFAVVVDPESSGSGSRLKGDLTIKTESDLENAVQNTETNLISGPGEYEFSGVKIRGQRYGGEKGVIFTTYKVVFESIRFGFIPTSLGELSEEAADVLSDVDVLFVPASDVGLKIVKRIAPKIAVPGEGDVKKFVSGLGREVEPEEKLVIKKKDLDSIEGIKVVTLKK